MSAVTWSREMSVNIRRMDLEHRELIDLMNALRNAIRMASPRPRLNTILTKLLNRAATHFANEEKMMVESGYPAYQEHKSEHEKIASNVKKLVADFAAGKVADPADIAEIPMKWLHSHIMTFDKLYTAHLNAKGVS